jgi:hypothetical protein
MVHLAAAVGKRATVIFGPTPMIAFGYPQHLNVGLDDCVPCFWNLPSWGSGTCTRGVPACINFPTVHGVLMEQALVLTQTREAFNG